jgi:hypothetical protein
MENTCNERYGFILKVFNPETERLEGRIESTGMRPGRGGTATFNVYYDAIVFRPFKNEVLIGVVKSVASQGVFCQCGPMQVFEHQLRTRVGAGMYARVPLPARSRMRARRTGVHQQSQLGRRAEQAQMVRRRYTDMLDVGG